MYSILVVTHESGDALLERQVKTLVAASVTKDTLAEAVLHADFADEATAVGPLGGRCSFFRFNKPALDASACSASRGQNNTN